MDKGMAFIGNGIGLINVQGLKKNGWLQFYCSKRFSYAPFPLNFLSDLSLVFYIGETCELSNTLAKSPCKMPCEKDDDCINHGRHTCCPTSPGSSCMGECLGENYL